MKGLFETLYNTSTTHNGAQLVALLDGRAQRSVAHCIVNFGYPQQGTIRAVTKDMKLEL